MTYPRFWRSLQNKAVIRHLSFVILLCTTTLLFGQRTIKILYVGNSLTYSNDMPVMVEEIGKLQGVTIVSTVLANPDYALEDHLKAGKVIEELASNHYDFLVAQQGPSARPESQTNLMEFTQKFSAECKKNKTRLALYMVWPSKARSFDFEAVIHSYTNAARRTSSILCPAGRAWLVAWSRDPKLPLYGPDEFHPSVTGSFLAAMVIYGSLVEDNDWSLLGYDKLSVKKDVTEVQFDLLKKSAQVTIGH